MSTKILGVIGGMGPQASAGFYETVIANTHAEKDQDHINMVIYSHADIPDRTEAIISGKGDEVVRVLQNDVEKLVDFGADYIVMTCNTAHYFIEELKKNKRANFIDMIEETVNYLLQKNIKKVGLLATDGTLLTRIYNDKLEANQIEVVVPSPENQALVMEIIYKQIKSGKAADDSMFEKITKELLEQDVEAIVTGCTELSYYSRINKLKDPFVDPQKLLAQKCIVLCGEELVKE